MQFAQVHLVLYNTLSPRQRLTTTVRSNDTLVDTSFQLISDFFHVNKVFSVLSMLSKLPPGVCWGEGGGGGGGGNRLAKYRLPGLVYVTKQKLWNFHRYWLVYILLLYPNDDL